MIPKLLIFTSGHIAILFGRFLELPKNLSNLDPRTPAFITKIRQEIQEKYGVILEQIIFISENLKL